MTYNDSYSTSDSEFIITNLDSERTSKGKTNLDFINDWINDVKTVENERRGKKLREEKPSPDKTEHEYDVINVNFFGSFCNEIQSRERRNHHKTKLKKSPSSPRSKSPYPRPTSASTAYSSINRILRTSTPRVKTKNQKRCSMRISELAVPTKRQCIDTWRNKSYILPQFMVERLKQHVMDQRPIVKIPEAINCFQRRRSQSSKNMERLSRIVASDITQMMGGKSQCVLNKIYSENRQKKSIHIDVSNKITVWIAHILEDLSFKLLEEDLRDLEEEEGPVLDFIDDVVDNVMNICEPPPVCVDEDFDTSDSSKDGIMGEESEKPLTPIDSTEKMSRLEQIYNIEEATATDATQSPTEETDDHNRSDEILKDSENFRKVIYNIIDNINQESREDISNRSGDEIENENNEVMSLKPEMKNDEDDENTNITNDNSDDIKQNDEHVEAIDNAYKNDSNVSGVFDILLEDPGDDTKSKKVKFSVKVLVNPEQITEHIITSTAEEPDTDEHEQIQWNSNDNTKSNIVFAEPNEHLLSDADESWPSDLTDKPWLKVSNSVSKSVTSLGRIYENDDGDKLTPPEGESTGTNKQKMGDVKREQAIIEELTKILPPDYNDIGSQTVKALTETYKKTATAETKTSTTKFDSKVFEDIGKSTVSKTHEDKYFDKSSKDQINIRETNIIKILSHTSQSQINYGWSVEVATQSLTIKRAFAKTVEQLQKYEVHPKTAPTWVTSWGQGRGEPSEDSILIQVRPTKVRASDIRKWCQDLEKAFINLEMWSNWIDNTCKETVFILKQKEIACPGLNRKRATNWIRLKKNIYKDAILWTKLHQRTKDNFKSLKRKYNNIEITAAQYSAVCSCNKIKTRKT